MRFGRGVHRYTPVVIASRGAKIAALCQVVGDYSGWVRILVFFVKLGHIY